METRHMGATEWGLFLALAGLWGSSFFFIKIIVTALPPFTVVLARVGVAALVLHLILWIQRRPMRLSLPWRSFFVMGLLNSAIPFSFIVWGETRISSGVASILNATTPVFTMVFAHFLTRTEAINAHRGLGILLGVGGVAVLMGPKAVSSLGSGDLYGEISCLLAASSYGFAGIYGRRFKGLPAIQVATGQMSTAAIIMLPIAAVTEHFWTLPLPPLHVWAALGGLSLLCTVLAYSLFFQILARAGATNTALITLLLPVVALLLGYFILGETFRLTSLAGMVLIGLSLMVIDGRLYRFLRQKIMMPQG